MVSRLNARLTLEWKNPLPSDSLQKTQTEKGKKTKNGPSEVNVPCPRQNRIRNQCSHLTFMYLLERRYY